MFVKSTEIDDESVSAIALGHHERWGVVGRVAHLNYTHVQELLHQISHGLPHFIWDQILRCIDRFIGVQRDPWGVLGTQSNWIILIRQQSFVFPKQVPELRFQRFRALTSCNHIINDLADFLIINHNFLAGSRKISLLESPLFQFLKKS